MTARKNDLGVLETTGFVVENSELVRIDDERVFDVASRLVHYGFRPPIWNHEYHFFDGTERTVNYLLLLDALNFCFWGEPKWTIEYRGERIDGYWALAAALKRAIEEGIPLYDATYLAHLEADQLRHILRGYGEIPLFSERLANAREAGQALLDRYRGQFAGLVQDCQGSAVRLARRLAGEFPSFHDVTAYKGRQVRFLKRAQICTVDLYGAFNGETWGRFHDLDAITAFADYKLPQVLRAMGILVYVPALATKVDRLEPIPAGSPEEVEIRANTIWAVEKLKKAVRTGDSTVRSFEIDWWLWQLGQDETSGMLPYHRTRTVYY